MSGEAISIEARPRPVDLDPQRSAVIVVDMQNDFGAVGGMFDRAGFDISGIRAAVAPTARVLATARRFGIPVVHLTMGYRSDLSDVGPDRSPNREIHRLLGVGDAVQGAAGTPSRVLVRDTWNTEIVSELEPSPNDTVIRKPRFSGFFETELDDHLRSLGAELLIFTGCTTSVCVESTVRDAMFRDYRPVLLEDCTAEPTGGDKSRTNHDASVFLIETLFGWVTTSAPLIQGLDRHLEGVEVGA